MPVAETDAAAEGPERKLATIVSADVVAYSRLMAEDEEHTLQIFRGHKEVFDKLVQLHRGRVFNTAGDAILAEFGSAVEAVRCASEIQAALRTRNDQLAPERRVMFRIGVNLGDVMVQGEDLLGDGVNVAARLQGAAEPGGICISGSVYDQIVNKLSLSFKPLGEMSYKNIPQLVRTFAIAEAAGLGTMPSPAHQHRAMNGRRLWPFVAAILLLITGGGAFWVYSHHQRSQAKHARVAERAAQQQLLVDQRRAENETRRLAEANPEHAEAGAFAAVAVPAVVSPQPIYCAALPPQQTPMQLKIRVGSIAGRFATAPWVRPSRLIVSRRRRSFCAIRYRASGPAAFAVSRFILGVKSPNPVKWRSTCTAKELTARASQSAT